MGIHVCVLPLWLFLSVSHVTTFDISNYKEDSSDSLAALAAFQRLRHIIGPEYMLDGKPLTGEDVHKWLSTSDVDHASSDSDGDAVWVSDKEHLLDDGYLRKFRDLSNNRLLDLLTLVPTKDELPSVFDAGEKEEVRPVYKKSVETKNNNWLKEEISNPDDFKIREQSKIFQPETEKTEEKASVTEDLSLDTLTNEEFKSLMTAIEKLRKQSSKFSSEPTEKPEVKVVIETTKINKEPDSILVVQTPGIDKHNTFRNNLQTSVAKAAVVFLETIPDLNNQRVFNKQFALNNLGNRTNVLNNIDLINDLAPDVEDNLVEDAEHDMPTTSKNTEIVPNDSIIIDNEKGLQHRSITTLKGSSIRDVSLVKAAIREILNDQVAVKKSSHRDALFGGSDHTISLPTEKTFVKRILELQDEVDKLAMILQLEELENDVLTDALNEASMGQGEGTVSRMEFDSLKQAIQIEEAVHDLKRREHDKRKTDDIIKIHTPLEQQKRNLDSVFNEATAESITDECPPVPDENTVCSWTNLDSIPADIKAKSLCGWKDTCCGCQGQKATTFHLGWKKCDHISEAVMSALCQDKDTCPLNSKNMLTTKVTSPYNMRLIPSHNKEPDFWTCRKGQKVGVWVCGYCWSV